jgi:RNA polymerase sigma-70 factor (ECF subfamily)
MTDSQKQAALAQARQGDTQTLGALLDSFRPYVRVLVHALHRGRLQSRLDDSDLVQDALLEAQRHFERFQGETVAEFAAWLRPVVLRSAGHVLRKHLAAARRDAGREQAGGHHLDQAADQGSSPSEHAIREERAARMAGQLAQLPEDMQQVLIGRHVDGLSHAELAERLGRSEGAVRVLYTRALRRLREECREE